MPNIGVVRDLLSSEPGFQLFPSVSESFMPPFIMGLYQHDYIHNVCWEGQRKSSTRDQCRAVQPVDGSGADSTQVSQSFQSELSSTQAFRLLRSNVACEPDP